MSRSTGRRGGTDLRLPAAAAALLFLKGKSYKAMQDELFVSGEPVGIDRASAPST